MTNLTKDDAERGAGDIPQSLRNRLLGVSPSYQAFLDAGPPLKSEPILGRTFLADGWTYKDLPQLTADQFETFQQVVGPENIQWLAHSELRRNGVTTFRGQMLLSPEGVASLKRYLDGGLAIVRDRKE